ncbi:hypothetical protein [Shewanella xiamenensis]|uniref:hypothetical protein n=1 Tax=Shewanella xiamenensis TaxID=332186 RepID=UPI001559091E|nr:hypothetical protein [Shewanella xiamenensis]
MAMGGYNQLQMNYFNSNIHPDAEKFQSARSALYAYLEAEKVKKIYLPKYICNSLLPILFDLSIEIIWYDINLNLLPIFKPLLEPDERFLVVNYYGLISAELEKFINGDRGYIVDNSQALFSQPLEGVVTIYSPRKFLPIPDGGFIYSHLKFTKIYEYYESEKYFAHLVLRGVGLVKEGYELFKLAEQKFDDFKPKRMSKLSNKLIEYTDLDDIREKRKNNFEFLNKKLNHINELDIVRNALVSTTHNIVPLCYPLMLKKNIDSIHAKLVSKDVFLPRYWAGDDLGNVGFLLYSNTLFLPIDERLSKKDLDFLVELILDDSILQ